MYDFTKFVYAIYDMWYLTYHISFIMSYMIYDMIYDIAKIVYHIIWYMILYDIWHIISYITCHISHAIYHIPYSKDQIPGTRYQFHKPYSEIFWTRLRVDAGVVCPPARSEGLGGEAPQQIIVISHLKI